jgi:hypothetical protein
LRETLEKDTKQSALALKYLLVTIETDPVPSECVIECGQLIHSRAYYVASSTIQTLALLEETKVCESGLFNEEKANIAGSVAVRSLGSRFCIQV